MKLKMVILASLSLLLINSCVSVPKNIKIFQGSSKDAGIIRAQDKSYVSCVDKKIDEYLCINKKDFSDLLMCK